MWYPLFSAMGVSASSSGTFFNETDIVELAVCGQAVALTCMQPIMIKKVASLMIRKNLCKRIGQPCEICLGRFWFINLVSLKSETLRFLLRNSRSEEHTSELQSLMRISYAVFCLKKKKIYINLNIKI